MENSDEVSGGAKKSFLDTVAVGGGYYFSDEQV